MRFTDNWDEVRAARYPGEVVYMHPASLAAFNANLKRCLTADERYRPEPSPVAATKNRARRIYR